MQQRKYKLQLLTNCYFDLYVFDFEAYLFAVIELRIRSNINHERSALTLHFGSEKVNKFIKIEKNPLMEQVMKDLMDLKV
jgi:hypothetical protein